MLAIIDCRMPKEAQDRLKELGFSVIPLPPFSRLAPPVASHPDMLLFPLGDRLFVHREYYEEAAATVDRIAAESGRVLCTVDTKISAEYPNDIALNLFTVGKYLIGRTDKTPAAILDYATTLGYEPIFVKQGYAKCSTVPLGDSAIITADPSIEKAARGLGIDALLISAGGVSLPGYEYGFLGGACGVCDKRIFFCGNPSSHPNGAAILAFCEGHGFDVLPLHSAPLFDVGSIFFLSFSPSQPTVAVL